MYERCDVHEENKDLFTKGIAQTFNSSNIVIDRQQKLFDIFKWNIINDKSNLIFASFYPLSSQPLSRPLLDISFTIFICLMKNKRLFLRFDSQLRNFALVSAKCSKYVYTTILIFQCANYNRRSVEARAFSESTCVCRSTSCHDIYFWFYVKYINEIVPVYSLDIAREILLYTFLFVQTYSRDRYVCVYVCTYVYTYVCMYLCTYHTNFPSMSV